MAIRQFSSSDMSNARGEGQRAAVVVTVSTMVVILANRWSRKLFVLSVLLREEQSR